MLATPASRHRARRTVALPPDPASPGRARVVLRQALRDGDRLDVLDAAELACTELVTNAVLHAHTTVVVTVEVATDVRVEVRDSGAALPHRRHLDAHATTGRGLALVAALSDSYGVADVGPDGKTVWFTVGGHRRRTEEEVLAAWDADGWEVEAPDPPVRTDSTARPVRLLGVPSALWVAARQHHDALLRELTLYLARHDDVRVDVVGTDRARFVLAAGVAAAVEEERRAREAARRPEADRAGDPDQGRGGSRALPSSPRPVDLDLTVPVELARDFAALQDTLDAAEVLARDGMLLTAPGLPEVIAVRDWVCEQVVAQLAGVAATPWTAYGAGWEPDADDAAHASHAADDVAAVRDGLEGLDTAGVAASSRPVAAADESNRLVAVSEPLARMLGWRPEQLVGRRIVALIPHRLREAHVAGFTRHQSTGETSILGVPLTVPALRADGTEVTCGLRIEPVALASGRTAYLAWFDADGGGAR